MKYENFAIMRLKDSFIGTWDEAFMNELENLEVVKTFEKYQDAIEYLENNLDVETHCVGEYNNIMTHTNEYFL